MNEFTIDLTDEQLLRLLKHARIVAAGTPYTDQELLSAAVAVCRSRGGIGPAQLESELERVMGDLANFSRRPPGGSRGLQSARG
jgi:hypothetical protein